MSLALQAFDKLLLRHYQVLWSKCIDKGRKKQGDCHVQRRTTWLLYKEGGTPSVISSLYRKNTGPQCCLGSTGYRASAVAGELHQRLPKSGIATQLSNGSVQPSGSCQKEMAAMYRHSKGICWGGSYSVLSPNVIKLLQIGWVQIISERPSWWWWWWWWW